MKYIITDPCYLATKKEWKKMGKLTDWAIEELKFPYKIKKGELLVIEGTGGDGSCGNIGVDSGTLCIAKISDPVAKNEKFGEIYNDLEKARQEFKNVIKVFRNY